jgi:hypothetical protein
MSSRFSHELMNPPKIQDLLVEHQSIIEKILTILTKEKLVNSDIKVQDAAKHAPLDELFVLRYVLSSSTKSTTKSDDVVDKILQTLQWRAERLDVLEDARHGRSKHHERMMKLMKFSYIGYLGGIHPTIIGRVGRSNQKAVFEGLSVEEAAEMLLMFNEQVYYMCDLKTRETGVLCKQIAIVDLEGWSILNWDPRFSKIVSKSSHLSAVYYPQLLGKKVLINMPSAFRIIYRAVSLIMPASALEKNAICSGFAEDKSVQDCPFLKKFANSNELIPTFLGGSAPTPAELLSEKELKALQKDSAKA